MNSNSVPAASSAAKCDFFFFLLPAFSGDTIDLLDTRYFPNGSRYQIAKYVTIENPYFENEIKAFIQHLAIDCKYSAATIHSYMGEGIRKITLYLNEMKYDQHSIVDFPFEKLYNQYLEYLADCHVSAYYETMHSIRKNMEVKAYRSKSLYLSSFVALYKFVYNARYPDTKNEYEKECWDVRNLGIPFSTAVARNRYIVNFACIKQPWLQNAAKKYIYYRIQNRTIAAVLDDLKALRIFSEFLSARHPELMSMRDIDRGIIEDFFPFLAAKGFVVTTYNHRLSALRTFFILGNMLGLEEFPEKPLVLRSDYRKITHKLPKYFSDAELAQINSHISELPIQTARMLFVLENCGMRLSDICSSTILCDGQPCLSKDSNSNYTFTYYMPKVHRYNTIPINSLVAEVIQEEISNSKRNYGEECKYIFAKSASKAFPVESFSYQLNHMSLNNKLVRDDGSPLRITGHTFRGTVATRYANCGISVDVICLMLGQKKAGVLKHYITIHDDDAVQYLKPITEESEHLIQNIGNLHVEIADIMEEPTLIPLSNGRCAKPIASGICDHAYACYSCRMFRPTKEFLSIYKAHYQEALNNIEIAQIHGYDRVLELNQKLKSALEKILTVVEGEMPNAEKGRGHCCAR